MRARILPLFMVLVFMTMSLSGCMGLIQARESLEGMRGEPVDKPYADKIGMSHTFQTESLLIDNSEPSLGMELIFTLAVIYPLLALIFAKKYQWKNWRAQLTHKFE